ncbi:MAG: hypothetical protein U0Q55_00600 [Vicinamibacterales bacterium]
MDTLHIDTAPAYTDIDWAPFSGGELEAPRPKVLCAACREKRASGAQQAGKPALCFQCYRAELDKNRKLAVAAELDTASVERFQTTLPFEPVNASRLAQLKAERAAARRSQSGKPEADYAVRRARAQMEARRALTHIFQGLKARRLVEAPAATASHAALSGRTLHGGGGRVEALELPESWLPFVVAR